MAIPTEVAKQAKEAEDLHKELYGDGKGKTPDGNIPIEGTPAIEAPEKPEAPAKIEGTPPGEVKPPEPQPIEAAKPPEEVDYKAEYEKLQPEFTKLERAHSVLQGKYSAEVPRLHAENKILNEKITGLEGKVQTLEAVKPAKVEPSAEDAKFEKHLIDEYGEDFAKSMNSVINRRVEAQTADIVKDVDKKLKPMGEQIENIVSSTAKSTKNTYVDRLTELVPDWRTIKDGPDFSQFLAEVEPSSGRTRHELAREANINLDAERVAYFYNAFKAQKKAVKPPPGNKDKTKLLTPPSTPKGALPAEEVKTMTIKEIQDFAKDVAIGKYKGRDAEMKAMESRMNQAIQAGKVVG